MGLLLLLAGIVAIAVGIAGLGLSSTQMQLRGFDATSAAVLVTGGLIVVGLSFVVGRLQRIAEAIETQAFHESVPVLPAPVANELQIPAATRMGAAAVAAALGDLSREPEPVRAAPEPVIAPPPPEPVLTPVPPPLAEAPEPRIEPVRAPPAIDAAPPVPPVTPPKTEPKFEPTLGEIRPTEWPTIDPGERLQSEPPVVAPVPPPAPSGPPIAASVAPPVQQSAPPPGPAPKTRPTPPPATDSFALGLEAVGGHGASEPQPASGPQVLKSGVIEGMAYTLYADGSVDAELPDGTRHFASIAEWRAYLREGNAA